MTEPEFSADELQADAESSKPLAISLSDIRALAERQKVLEEEVIALEAQTMLKRSELRQVAEKELPDMLALVGVSSVTLVDGSVVEISDLVSASITDENRAAAHGWLREQGCADLIKNSVSVVFGKDEDCYAQLLIDYVKTMSNLGKLKFGTLDTRETIHPSTLKAFIKEKLSKGEPIPIETFKVFIGQVAKIKKKRVKE